jgi:hypothetical protein
MNKQQKRALSAAKKILAQSYKDKYRYTHSINGITYISSEYITVAFIDGHIPGLSVADSKTSESMIDFERTFAYHFQTRCLCNINVDDTMRQIKHSGRDLKNPVYSFGIERPIINAEYIKYAVDILGDNATFLVGEGKDSPNRPLYIISDVGYALIAPIARTGAYRWLTVGLCSMITDPNKLKD